MNSFRQSSFEFRKTGSRLQETAVQLGQRLDFNDGQIYQEETERSLEALRQQKIREAEISVRKILERAREEAGKILTNARDEAARIVQDGEAMREEVISQARDEGYRDGHEHGYRDGTDKLQAETVGILEAANMSLEKAYVAEQRILHQFRKDAAAIIGHVCEAVLGRTLTESPEKLLDMVDRAIESLHLSGKVKVVVHERFLEYLDGLPGMRERLSRLEWSGDAAIGMTDVFILSLEGSFNLSLPEQVQRLVNAVTDQLPLPAEKAAPEKIPEETSGLPLETNSGEA